jgi:hormone-sensitive lipase
VYLKFLAKKLDCPVISVDYSLAPQSPYPMALNQCFFVYCYALKYPEKFGWTGEKIVLSGDSAGANLVTCCTTKIIECEIPRPTGLITAYGVFLARHGFLPSRFSAFFDTLLPYKIYNRIFGCYRGLKDRSYINKDGNIKHLEIPRADENFETNYLVSPYYTPKHILEQFPPTYIISTNMDPCLDECVEMAKLMKSYDVNVNFRVLKDLPHGFLGLTGVNKEFEYGTLEYANSIRNLFKMD